MTKKAIQRLSAGARFAIAKHSATNNVSQLRHDLQNCPSHVFGDHSRCSVEFCTFRQSETTPANDDIELQNTPPTSDAADTNIEQQIDTIIQEETDTTTLVDERDATHGGHPSLTPHVAPGLLNAIAKCPDRIVSLAPQLITNQTSNLAESYMSIRSIMDGGKQFNRIQTGSFEHRCATAGLATQHGPGWMTSFWTAATKREAGPVLSAHTSAKIRKLAADNKRKDTKEYKAQRKSTRTKSAASTDQHYGPNCQQDDVSPSELLQLCQEFHQRELNVTPQQRSYIEHHTKGQSEDSLWHHQHKLRLTASNLVKSLLYSKAFSTEATCWGTQHEDDVKKQCLEYLQSSGYPAASIKESSLVIDDDTPSLACNPDGLVDIPGEDGGYVEFKCPYKVAKENLDPLSAAKTLKTLFCKASVEGNLEFKRRHDYFYQVQRTMAITGRSWCDFVVWSPKGTFVEWIKFDQDL